MNLGINPTLFLVFICAAATIYAIIRTVAPFLEDPEDQMRIEMLDEELEQIERLVARKSVLLQSLQDIEFDHSTGKLSDEDYEKLKSRYERQAVRVMRELDDVRGGVDMEDEIDTALESRLRPSPPEHEQGGPAEEESPPANTTEPPGSERTEEDKETDRRTCPECGRELEADARFCSGCGVSLEEDAEGDSARDAADRNVSELRSEATG